MSGGLMQLVAYGAQDVYLTGRPQITFFKVVYRRHTNFSTETIEQTLSGTIDFGKRQTVTILRNGDLAMQVYLKVILPAVTTTNLSASLTPKFAWIRRLGHAMIDYIELQIGGATIDKHWGHWMDVWYELTRTDNQERGYAKLIGDVDELTELKAVTHGTTYKDAYTMYIPLQFWFNRNPGLALPLIALQYHEVKLNIQLFNYTQLYIYTGTTAPSGLSITDASLLVEYVYLDSDERRRFAQVGHEYLIEQLQFVNTEAITSTTSYTTSGNFRLNFNHPTKELIWMVKSDNFTGGNTFLHYTNKTSTAEWSTALDTAAYNLICRQLQTGATGKTLGTYEINVSESNDYYSNSAYASGYNHQITITNVAIDGLTISGTGADAYFTDGDSVTGKLFYTRDALIDTTLYYALSDKIDSIIVTVGITDTYVVIKNVAVIEHDLTVRDISIPIENWAADRRLACDTTGPYYVPYFNNGGNTDVTVYQFNNYGVLLDGSGNPISRGKIVLNGHDRFDEREGPYFNYYQTYQAHTHTPADGVNVYSFALHPENHQPSGSANLSRIDNTQINLTFIDPTYQTGYPSLKYFSAAELYVYDFNYNVLRVMSGMAGTAYSN